ncbi:unnamed protein product [Alopecurus aequalis]
MWTAYLILLGFVLLLTVSRLQFPGIIKLVDWALGRKMVFWSPVILNMSMVVAIVMLVCTFPGILKVYIFTLEIMALVTVSFGNLQIPAAVLRIGLALYGVLKAKKHYGDHGKDNENLGDMTNLVPTLIIFYGMVLGQGTLYIVASIIEIFSFIPRRSLMRRGGFRGSARMEYVNLYYAYAFEKCMEGAVLAPVKTSLVTFAMDSLKSDSPKMQLYGLKMLYVFLQNEHLKTKAISELTTCTETMVCLVNMFGWTSEGEKDIRSFAAKVIAEIADNLQVVHVPGAMQLIASLLDTIDVREIKDPFLDISTPEPKQEDLIQKVSRSFLQKKVSKSEHTSLMLKWLKKMTTYCFIPREDPTNMDEEKPHILRFWKWSAPEEESSTDVDLLPLLAMLILDKIASFDLESCIQTYKETCLISKIIEFTTNGIDMTHINETHKVLLKGSSLKLLRRLSSTKGKYGVTLRQKISEHPFLLSHLSEILDDNGNSQEIRELTIELLRNLAMDINLKEEIGHMPVIISKLMHAFLSQGASSTTYSGQVLRMISGQALVVLSMDSANNCLAMLAETGYVFIKELTVMINCDRYKYIASSLLRNICVHARSELDNSDMKEISSILREVLERIMDAEGAELEVLVGLSSQICNAIPGDFARELERGEIKERFIKRLVDALTSNMTPTAHCSGIRRVIVEHVIYMMECDPGYANCFKKYRMMEALLRVERTPSKAENYKFFMGDAGLMKHSVSVSALVSRAKELMSRE